MYPRRHSSAQVAAVVGDWSVDLMLPPPAVVCTVQLNAVSCRGRSITCGMVLKFLMLPSRFTRLPASVKRPRWHQTKGR